MAVKQVSVPVSAGLYDAGQALGKFVTTLRAAVKTGWNPGTAIPALVEAAIADLGPVITGVENAAAEVAENPNAAANAVALGLAEALLPAPA